MPFGRFLIQWRDTVSTPVKDAMTNTLYFNITTVDPFEPADWQQLVDDLYAVQALKSWIIGRQLDVRAYDMGDAEPRPIKARKMGAVPGTIAQGPHQIALALSYYADRNLPRQRGRIFCGPFSMPSTNAERAADARCNEVLALAQAYADIGGVNVDWSLWSPTTQQHTRISNAWVDNSWDVIRSRKLPSTARFSWSGDG